MDSRPLPGQLAARVRAGRHLSQHLILPIAGARCVRATMRIRELVQARPRFGDTRIWILLRREGWRDNKKRVHRLYRLEGLQVRLRTRRKKRLSLHRGAVPPAAGRHQYWSRDSS